MKQVTALTSTYSSDQFGICSALYELGGMVVMHDASGCNSTYTTHDEPRWYSRESMIYISALSEVEAVTGDDEKLVRDIVETAEELKPAFIAVVGGPIPYMTGTDFRAVASLIEKKTGIPSFGFEADGMQGYLTGVSMALEAVVKRFCIESETGFPERKDNSRACGKGKKSGRRDGGWAEEKYHSSRQSAAYPGEPSAGQQNKDQVKIFFSAQQGGEKNSSGSLNGEKKKKVNIVGATPLDIPLNGTLESIRGWLEESGFEPGACLAMGSSLEEIAQAGSAQTNLVVSYGGMAAAREMERRFGIPWTAGVPVGKKFAAELAGELRKTAGTGESRVGYTGDSSGEGKTDGSARYLRNDEGKKWEFEKRNFSSSLVFIGESIFGGSLARAVELEAGRRVRVFCPLETEDRFLREGDLRTPEEDDLLVHLKGAGGVIADPLYRPLCQEGTKFYPLPHTAFSGRMFEGQRPNLIGRKLNFLKK